MLKITDFTSFSSIKNWPFKAGWKVSEFSLKVEVGKKIFPYYRNLAGIKTSLW